MTVGHFICVNSVVLIVHEHLCIEEIKPDLASREKGKIITYSHLISPVWRLQYFE